MSYKHLSLEERHYIELSLKNEMTLTEIARMLDRSQSTIYRELARNTGRRGYRHRQAERLATERHEVKPKAIKLTDDIRLIIDKHIALDWRPEQICGRLKSDGILNLHHETIYHYILTDKQAGGELYKHLRH
ncbi:MAG: IS30 family transposase, partial [Candidatus Azotimanducaceae bacterium]